MQHQLALMDTAPSYCPGCAHEFTWNRYSDQDWGAGASHQCPRCGLCFARATSAHLFAAADASGSDLSRYAD